MAGYQDTQLPHAPDGADLDSDILAGVTDSAELDGNEGLDLPPLPGNDFNEHDPEERDELADRMARLRDLFGPRDDPFDEALPGDGEGGLYGGGRDRLYDGDDRDGHDSGDADGHDSGGTDEPSGGMEAGAETIFGGTSHDRLEGSGEDRPDGGFGSETIFGGLDEDRIGDLGEDGSGDLGEDGSDGDQGGEGDILDGAALSGDPNLEGNDGLEVPMGPNFGEADPSSLETLPGRDLPDGSGALGGGMGEDHLLGGGTDTYWKPSDAGGSDDETAGGSESDDSEQVSFPATPLATGDPEPDGEPADNPLTIGALLDAEVGSLAPSSSDIPVSPVTAPLGLDTFDSGLLTGIEILA